MIIHDHLSTLGIYMTCIGEFMIVHGGQDELDSCPLGAFEAF